MLADSHMVKHIIQRHEHPLIHIQICQCNFFHHFFLFYLLGIVNQVYYAVWAPT